MRPCGKHSPGVRKKMRPFALVAWPTAGGCRPKVFMHFQIAIPTSLGLVWLRDCSISRRDCVLRFKGYGIREGNHEDIFRREDQSNGRGG